MLESRKQKSRYWSLMAEQDDKGRCKTAQDLKVQRERQRDVQKRKVVHQRSRERRMDKRSRDQKVEEYDENRDPNIIGTREVFGERKQLHKWESEFLQAHERKTNDNRRTRRENGLQKCKATSIEKTEHIVDHRAEGERTTRQVMHFHEGVINGRPRTRGTQSELKTPVITDKQVQNNTKRNQRRDPKDSGFCKTQEPEKKLRIFKRDSKLQQIGDETENTLKNVKAYTAGKCSTRREQKYEMKELGECSGSTRENWSRETTEVSASMRSERNSNQTTGDIRQQSTFDRSRKSYVFKRKEFCRDYHYRGSCTFGQHCRYIHTRTDLADTAHFLICLYWHTNIMSLNKKVPYFQGKDGYESYFFISTDMIPNSGPRPPIFVEITAASLNGESSSYDASCSDVSSAVQSDISNKCAKDSRGSLQISASSSSASTSTRNQNLYDSTKESQATSQISSSSSQYIYPGLLTCFSYPPESHKNVEVPVPVLQRDIPNVFGNSTRRDIQDTCNWQPKLSEMQVCSSSSDAHSFEQSTFLPISLRNSLTVTSHTNIIW